MAVPAPTRAEAESTPAEPAPVILLGVRRNLAQARVRRLARIEHELERRRAAARFRTLIVSLLLLAVFLSLTIRQQIQTIFGL